MIVITAIAIPGTSAEQNVYVSLTPDSKYCDSVTFGGFGKGEYTLNVYDPGYPENPWVDMHRVSFTSGPANPVIIPVCFNTDGRRKGDNAVLTFNIDAPQSNITFNYGICVSEFEDMDMDITGYNPCESTSTHTDIFSMYLLENNIYANPGEKIETELLVSSDMDISVSLDKESGPKMVIGKTSVELPGQERISIEMDAPSSLGLYNFTITGKVDGCDSPSCTRTALGILHVTDAQEGFSVHVSPESKNVIGIRPATFFLTIDNFEKTGTFKIGIETDNEIETDFTDREMVIAGGSKNTIPIVAVPKNKDHKLHVIKISAENEDGKKHAVGATLTVDEALSDINRAAENDPNVRNDADVYTDIYESGADIDDWEDINGRILRDDVIDASPANAAPDMNLIILLAVAGIISGVGVFIVYKKTRVSSEMDNQQYQPLDAQYA